MSLTTMSDPWWGHPDRPCKDDDDYSDILGISERERHAMARACASCPVFFDCLTETLKMTKTDFYGIRAGLIGKA